MIDYEELHRAPPSDMTMTSTQYYSPSPPPRNRRLSRSRPRSPALNSREPSKRNPILNARLVAVEPYVSAQGRDKISLDQVPLIRLGLDNLPPGHEDDLALGKLHFIKHGQLSFLGSTLDPDNSDVKTVCFYSAPYLVARS